MLTVPSISSYANNSPKVAFEFSLDVPEESYIAQPGLYGTVGPPSCRSPLLTLPH